MKDRQQGKHKGNALRQQMDPIKVPAAEPWNISKLCDEMSSLVWSVKNSPAFTRTDNTQAAQTQPKTMLCVTAQQETAFSLISVHQH